MTSTELSQDLRKAFLFDVDGVLTDPVTKVVDPQMIKALAKKLHQGYPVTLNTGRSVSWLIKPLIAALMVSVKNPKDLDNLYIIGEKGGTWLMGKDLPSDISLLTEKNITVDNRNTVSANLQERIRSLVLTKYADTMFYDETKLTMITVEMQDGVGLEIFATHQKELVHDLQAIIADLDLASVLKIDPTQIATDIEHSQSGKALGAKRMLALFADDSLDPHTYHYICFGDSASDADMATELHRQGFPVTFVFVGSISQFSQEKVSAFPFQFVQTPQSFDAGTIMALES